MSTSFLLIVAFVMVLGFFLQPIWIARMHALKIEQGGKAYGLESHNRTKIGTPSMGGVLFPVCAFVGMSLMLVLGMSSPSELLFIWIYPFLAGAVGFLDDFLKFRSHSGEGLSSLQKLFLQIAATVPWAVGVAWNGVNLWPGLELSLWGGCLLLIFLGVGIQNALNVTDGLDGLAAGCVIISLLGCFYFFRLQTVILRCSMIGMALVLPFLWHNANPAHVFMGDGGAHFLAGLILSLCVHGNGLAAVVPMSFMYGVEIVSVAVQIFAIRVLGRRVFRMSPIHHHFELLGWSENQIVIRFWMIQLFGMMALGLPLMMWVGPMR